jgi:hypothetical protein
MIAIAVGCAGLLLLALSIAAAAVVVVNLPRVIMVTPTADLALAVGRLLPTALAVFLVTLLLGTGFVGWSLHRLLA